MLQWTQISDLTKETAGVWRAPGFEIIISDDYHVELHREVAGKWHIVGIYRALGPAKRVAEAMGGRSVKIEQPDNALAVLESILDCAYCWVAEDNDDERKLDEEWEAAHASARHALECHNDLLAALKAFLRAPSTGSDAPSSLTIVVQEFNLKAARAAIAKAESK